MSTKINSNDNNSKVIVSLPPLASTSSMLIALWLSTENTKGSLEIKVCSKGNVLFGGVFIGLIFTVID
jgi:hypothetical protein